MMTAHRRFRFFLSFIIVLYTTSICGQERPKMERFLTVKPTSASFGADGGSKTFTVRASGTWKISSNPKSWIHLTKDGNSLYLRVDENAGTSSRSGSFELVAGEKKVNVSVTQNGSTSLSVSSENLNFSSSGGTKTITITTNGTWEIGTCAASWGHLTKNGNQLSIKIDPNSKPSSRTDWFSIKAGNKEKRINITQSGSSSSLSVSSDNINFGPSGGTQVITITTNGTWEIGTSTASWGHLTKSGNQISVRTDPNTGTSTRSDWFTVKVGNNEKRINITQSGTSATTSSKSAIIKTVSVYNDVDVDGKKGLSVHVSLDISGMKGTDAMVSCYFYDSSGNALVNINSNYGTTGSPSYVAVSKSIKPGYENTTYSDLEIKIPYDELHLSGMYSGTLRVDVLIWDYSSSNHTVLTRKENNSFTCVVDMSYLKVDGSTSNKTKYFGENGGREYYSVSTSAGSYETWGVPSWCSIENKTSSGFTLVCNRNTNRTSRSDYMKVKAAGQEIRIDINQEASSGPSATITSVEQEYNVYNGYAKGMNIKLKFDVSGMLNRTVKATAWFYYGDNTTKLNNGYGGQVNVSKSDTAPYENTTFTMTLFLPYNSLNMAHGFNGDLSFDIVITDSYGNQLTRQDNSRFKFSQP